GIIVKYRRLIVLLMLVDHASPMKGALSEMSPYRITGSLAEKVELGTNVLWAAKPHAMAVTPITEHRIWCWPLSADLKNMTPSSNLYTELEDDRGYPVLTANINPLFIL
ncbi:hypothetical protein, partial [Pontibacterium sp.]|uniref:hypothetical protein n=1 Tax=Pontibacterium sp. TaxID=2036026 RepID=UPI003567B42E